jgi:two-component system chemotaxis response regulator CheB
MKPTAKTVKVLVVDDSFFMRKVICDMLATDPRVDIVGQAGSGVEALDKIEQLRPDIMTLDLEMPHMDGLETLRKLKHAPYAPATLVVSAHSRHAAEITLDCLSAGALDFILKPSETNAWALQNTSDDLRAKLNVAIAVGARNEESPEATQALISGQHHYDVVVIGASTGGPVALENILAQLPGSLPCPVLVAQHMPSIFFEALTQRLAKTCKAPIVLAENGQSVQSGTVYFCPGGAITEIVNEVGPVFHIQHSDDLLTPSIDAVMTSAANYYADRTAALILTGMGEDGLQGAETVHQQGGTVMVQDQASSAVFGMGKAVVNAGLADVVLPLNELIPQLLPRLSA